MKVTTYTMPSTEHSPSYGFELTRSTPEAITIHHFSKRLTALRNENLHEFAPDPNQNYTEAFFATPARFLQLLTNPSQQQLRYGQAMLDDVANSFIFYKKNIRPTTPRQNRIDTISKLVIDCWTKQLSYLLILVTDIQDPGIRRRLREKIKKLASETEKKSTPNIIKDFPYPNDSLPAQSKTAQFSHQLAALAYEITEQIAVDDSIETARALRTPPNTAFQHPKPEPMSSKEQVEPTPAIPPLDIAFTDTVAPPPPDFEVDLTDLSHPEPVPEEVSSHSTTSQTQTASAQGFKREMPQSWFKRTARRAVFFLGLAGAATLIYKANESPGVQTLTKDTPPKQNKEIKEGQKEKTTQESLDKAKTPLTENSEKKEPQIYRWGARAESRYIEHALDQALYDVLGAQVKPHSSNIIENIKLLMEPRHTIAVAQKIHLSDAEITAIPTLDTVNHTITAPPNFSILAKKLLEHAQQKHLFSRRHK